MYARTVRIPADVLATGVLVKVPTLLIIHGSARVFTENDWVEFEGYNVLTGEAFRKQAFLTRSAVEMTMLFVTEAQTVEQAESEFTDECDLLMSRKER